MSQVKNKQTKNVKTQIEDAIRSSFTKETTEKGEIIKLSFSERKQVANSVFIILNF